jgi:hypothetical protein
MKSLALVLIVGILLVMGVVIVIAAGGDDTGPVGSFGHNSVSGEATEAVPASGGRIHIEGLGDFDFDPAAVQTVREDIFAAGNFSIFDILAHLDEGGLIDMDYHFDAGMNTNVIDAIDGREYWWYVAFYDGGWEENNNFRMDHYPYKERMYIRLFPSDKFTLDIKYAAFREEIVRNESNSGKIIIPEVIILGPDGTKRFEDVEVKPHDLRTDTFQPGVITAIDVIMTLGDEGRLSYDLQWRESVGSAEVVRSYWVSRIDEDVSYGSCGFVYEAGNWGMRGNHIHIPADSRVINSPEYEQWFWICL